MIEHKFKIGDRIIKNIIRYGEFEGIIVDIKKDCYVVNFYIYNSLDYIDFIPSHLNIFYIDKSYTLDYLHATIKQFNNDLKELLK